EGHPFFAVSLPYSRFELGLGSLVPNPATRLVLCDAADGVAERAAARAEAAGYSNVGVLAGGGRRRGAGGEPRAAGGNVGVLAGGVQRWGAAGYTLYAGVNVPSKAFGEIIEHARNTPRVTAEMLQAMCVAGEDVVILDGRTFAEFQKMCIPGGVSCPNGD